jgi:WD40 repeat protein
MTDGRIRIWDYVTGKWIEDIRGHGRAVSAVAFSPDGESLASTSNDGSAILWDMTKTPLNVTLDGPVGWGCGLAFSPDGRFMTAGGNEIKIWEWPSLRPAATCPGGRWPHFAQGGNVLSATFNHKGDRPGDSVRIFFPDGMTSSLDTSGDTIRCVAFSANGDRLVTVGHEKTIAWDVPSSKRLWDIQQLSISADVSPNASVVAIGGIGSLSLHDLETGRLLVQSAALSHKGFGCVRFSHSGKRLATAAWDGTIQIWNANNLSLERQIVGHANFVNSLAFSPEGKRLASASSGGDVRLWDASTGDLTAVLHGSLSITGNPARGLAFSPDGTALLSATSEGQIRIWRAAPSQGVARRVSENESL